MQPVPGAPKHVQYEPFATFLAMQRGAVGGAISCLPLQTCGGWERYQSRVVGRLAAIIEVVALVWVGVRDVCVAVAHVLDVLGTRLGARR